MIKNMPAMQETRVRSLIWEDPLEKKMATHSSILAWGNPRDRGAWWASVHGVAKSWTRLNDQTTIIWPHSSYPEPCYLGASCCLGAPGLCLCPSEPRSPNVSGTEWGAGKDRTGSTPPPAAACLPAAAALSSAHGCPPALTSTRFCFQDAPGPREGQEARRIESLPDGGVLLLSLRDESGRAITACAARGQRT